jgi:hypothetical protein
MAVIISVLVQAQLAEKTLEALRPPDSNHPQRWMVFYLWAQKAVAEA